ncbi:SEL1-like repeat protein [Rhizobium sp. MHM7A]|uniref:SEL1-like repeat protein n=1 Tax=Rhizobium sp. MHM7A TaxID=2583233 RepID=UPI0011071F38|nr:SEL1-like repeat protein [Rhizobium sp. MHM7A]TLX15777.1 hypothetical protein FFR93_00225 [Rhizobium sp. MHM7A]
MKKAPLIFAAFTLLGSSHLTNLVFAADPQGQRDTSAQTPTEGDAADQAKALKAAAAGEPEAAWKMGLHYQTGDGVAKNLDEAVRWFSSVESGLTYRALGDLYRSELSNMPVALKWYRKASELGDAKAYQALGEAYLKGNDVPQDYAEAIRCYELAAKELPEVTSVLADLYEKGEGVPMDYSRMLKWLEQGVQQEDPRATFKFAKRLVQRDPQAAMALYKKAADLGNVDALSAIASMHLDGDGTPKDVREAIRWYLMAAQKGDIKAYTQLGVAHQNLSPPEHETALEWYKKGAANGDITAMRNLALMYRNGTGVQQNAREAISWYERAAEHGDVDAMITIAVTYQDGQGVERSYSNAGLWYEKAAAAGDDASNLSLASLFAHGLGVNRDFNLAVDLAELAISKNERAKFSFQHGWENWPPEFLKAFQSRLVERGYYEGAVDGQYGPLTHWAIHALHSSGKTR